MPPNRSSRGLDRSQLPDEFTPESVRAMGMRTARLLARHDNGVLTPTEQVAFDRALRQVWQGTTERLGRARRVGPAPVDPDLRRSYQRAQLRLDDQARRARRSFPELTERWDDREADPTGDPAGGVDTVGDDTESPTVAPETTVADTDDAGAGEDLDDQSIGTFEAEIVQTSDTLEILEQIATIQQQQLDHQRSQLLSETRGVFFALAVSVAVIVAGIAPLVEATPDDRRLILLWTVAVCAFAALGYAVVRAIQSRTR